MIDLFVCVSHHHSLAVVLLWNRGKISDDELKCKEFQINDDYECESRLHIKQRLFLLFSCCMGMKTRTKMSQVIAQTRTHTKQIKTKSNEIICLHSGHTSIHRKWISPPGLIPFWERYCGQRKGECMCCCYANTATCTCIHILITKDETKLNQQMSPAIRFACALFTRAPFSSDLLSTLRRRAFMICSCFHCCCCCSAGRFQSTFIWNPHHIDILCRLLWPLPVHTTRSLFRKYLNCKEFNNDCAFWARTGELRNKMCGVWWMTE